MLTKCDRDYYRDKIRNVDNYLWKGLKLKFLIAVAMVTCLFFGGLDPSFSILFGFAIWITLGFSSAKSLSLQAQLESVELDVAELEYEMTNRIDQLEAKIQDDQL